MPNTEEPGSCIAHVMELERAVRRLQETSEIRQELMSTLDDEQRLLLSALTDAWMWFVPSAVVEENRRMRD